MKTAILYYSRTGNTENAAEILESKLKEKENDVELIEIKAKKRLGFFKANKVAIKQNELPIKNSNCDLSDYNKIIIGIPSWANHPAPFYKTFINKSKGINNQQFFIFITGSRSISSNEPVIKFMKNELFKLGVINIEAELILKMRKGKIVDGKNKIDSFVNKIGG
jgi:flavodoxin